MDTFSSKVATYDWGYQCSDPRIQRLYDLAKKLAWNAASDLPWNSPLLARDKMPVLRSILPLGYEPYENLSANEKLDFAWEMYAWMISQFMHGEQGALLAASQLVAQAPTLDVKLFASAQTFEEARHAEAFTRYLRERVGKVCLVDPYLKNLLDRVLNDTRWDVKLIGMQIVVEGLALASFTVLSKASRDPLFQQLVEYILRDESRHVSFGVMYLESYLRSLSPADLEERAQFAYESCFLMRERLIAREVYARFGFDVEDARAYVLARSGIARFRQLLFSRVVPALEKIGLITAQVRPLYQELGLLNEVQRRDVAECM